MRVLNNILCHWNRTKILFVAKDVVIVAVTLL